MEPRERGRKKDVKQFVSMKEVAAVAMLALARHVRADDAPPLTPQTQEARARRPNRRGRLRSAFAALNYRF
jgi:hypothetical protein